MVLTPSELKDARLSRNVSQSQLAAKSGVHIVMISRIENGRTDARISTMQALTDALGVAMSFQPEQA
jgi:transcriptional regulator with XRE-family HTH domain